MAQIVKSSPRPRTLLHRNSRGTTFKLHSQFLFADARNKPEAVERWGQGFSEADRITEQKDVDRQEDERKPKKTAIWLFSVVVGTDAECNSA